MLVGKTRRQTIMLLGMPDTTTAGAMLWRYSNAVQIYDPGLDLTFFGVELAFNRSLQSGPGPFPPPANGIAALERQMDDTINRLTLISVPQPKRGQVRQ